MNNVTVNATNKCKEIVKVTVSQHQHTTLLLLNNMYNLLICHVTILHKGPIKRKIQLKSHRLQWYQECRQHSRAALKHTSSSVLTITVRIRWPKSIKKSQ